MRMECYHQRHIVCKIYVIYYKKLEQKDVEQQRTKNGLLRNSKLLLFQGVKH